LAKNWDTATVPKTLTIFGTTRLRNVTSEQVGRRVPVPFR
jgi:hypothetical protein